jgi:hypothetical protein
LRERRGCDREHQKCARKRQRFSSTCLSFSILSLADAVKRGGLLRTASSLMLCDLRWSRETWSKASGKATVGKIRAGLESYVDPTV